MKQLHELLEYVNYYEYSKTREKIVFAPGPYHQEARKPLPLLRPSAFLQQYGGNCSPSALSAVGCG